MVCAVLERISLVWSHHLKQLLQGIWSFLQYPVSALLPLSLSAYHWRCLSSIWSSRHWFPSYTLCRFCRGFLLWLPGPGPAVIKLVSCSTQLSLTFQMLITIKYQEIWLIFVSDKSRMPFFSLLNVKMPTIVGILTFMSRKSFMLSWVL